MGCFREPHLWRHRSKQPSHTAHAGGFFISPDPLTDLDERKRALRARLVAARRDLPAEARAAAARAVAGRVAALPAFAAARAVALYAPMGGELDTGPLADLAAAAGKLLCWPRLLPGMRALAFAACAPEALVPGPLGTRQPPPDAPPPPEGALGLLCVPGVAFDAALRRLGRGGGWYDATLPALAGRALRVGLCLDLQVVAEVPAGPGDAPVDRVVTEARVLGG